MMKSVVNLLLFVSIFGYSQNDTLQLKLDSIVQEADLLYQYEKVAWESSDLFNSSKLKKENLGGYIVFHSSDTVKAVYFDSSLQNSIAEYSFLKDTFLKPVFVNENARELTGYEKGLAKIRNNFLRYLNANILSMDYVMEEGFTPNIIILQDVNGYRAYLIMGTSYSDVIPFGNDYLFKLDATGKLLNWKKFHKTLIKTKMKDGNGNIAVSFVHSHLPMTPYVSATDICTFRLYGVDLFGKKTFIVSSTALDLLFEYNGKTNKVRYLSEDQISEILN